MKERKNSVIFWINLHFLVPGRPPAGPTLTPAPDSCAFGRAAQPHSPHTHTHTPPHPPTHTHTHTSTRHNRMLWKSRPAGVAPEARSQPGPRTRAPGTFRPRHLRRGCGARAGRRPAAWCSARASRGPARPPGEAAPDALPARSAVA